MSILTALLRLLGLYWMHDAWISHDIANRRAEFLANMQKVKEQKS